MEVGSVSDQFHHLLVAQVVFSSEREVDVMSKNIKDLATGTVGKVLK
jgi:hypothetical protein